MQLREALNNIAEIRAQLERTESFRGLRSVAVSASSVLVFCGAMAGQHLLDGFKSSPRQSAFAFVLIWATVAFLSLCGAVFEMWFRAHQSKVQDNKRVVWVAHRALLVRLFPSLFVGGVLTVVVIQRWEMSWVLPGLWGMMYSLGLINCRQHLPRIAKWAAGYFLLIGAGCLLWSIRSRGLDAVSASWQMVIVFGIGQLLLAGLIYWNLERPSGKTEI